MQSVVINLNFECAEWKKRCIFKGCFISSVMSITLHAIKFTDLIVCSNNSIFVIFGACAIHTPNIKFKRQIFLIQQIFLNINDF